MKHLILFLVFAVSQAYTLHGQRPLLLHFTEQDGLPSNELYDVFQDHNGFIWVGTNQGVCRFDGHGFKTFTTRDGLPDNDVFTIREDRYGRCWLVCFKPLPCYIFNGLVYHAGNDSLCKKLAEADIEYKAYLKDNTGRDFLIGKRLCTIDRNDLSQPFPNLSSKRDQLDYFSERQGDYYFSDGGLYKLQHGQGKLLYQFLHARILATHAVNGHFLFAVVTEDAGTMVYDLAVQDTIVSCISRMPISHFCYSFYTLSQDEVIITTDAGLLSYNLRTRRCRPSGLIRQPLAINRMIADDEGNYWFATIGDGVYLLLNSKARTYDAVRDLKTGHVLFSYAIDSSQIIAAYNDGTFSIFRNGRRTDYKLPQHGAQNRILYAVPFGSNKLLTGSDQGAFITDLHTGASIALIPNAQKDLSYAGGYCYVAGAGSVYRIDTGSLSATRIWATRTTAIAEDRMHNLWMGTLNGLYLRKDGRIQKFEADHHLSAAHITSLCTCGDKLIIATHKDGLYAWNGHFLKHITTGSGISSNTCKKVVGDNEGHVWLSTDAGVDKISFSGDTTLSVYHYTRADGLINPKVNHITTCGNHIILSTSQGIFMLDKQPLAAALPPRIYITSVQTKDTTFNDPVSLKLDYASNDLEINFTGISFANGNTIKYKYVLEGAGNDTVFTDLGAVNLGAVRSGNYRFVVWASAGNSGWSQKPAVFAFQISRPFWASPWFVAGIACLLATAAWLLHRRKLRVLSKAEEERLERQRQMAQLEIDALRTQINPHFMFNVLTSIQSFYSNNNERKANYYITSFAQLVRKLLIHSKDHWILLSEETAILKTYLELEQMRFNNRFQFEIDLAPGVNVNDIQFPAMLIQPYVENAVKHGISHLKDSCGLVRICFEQKEHGLLCTIDDNGIGIDTVINNKPIGHQSMGMKINKQRIAVLNQLYRMHITLSIQDKRRKDPALMGTIIEIFIPKPSS